MGEATKANALIGAVIFEIRKGAKLSRPALAARASVSASLIEKIELEGKGVSLRNLAALITALGIADLPADKLFFLATRPEEALAAIEEAAVARPDVIDVAFLHASPFAACMHRPASFDLVEMNDAFREVFPGVERYSSFLEYLLLDDTGRLILPREEVHLLVGSFHCLSPATVTEHRRDELARSLMRSPDFEELFQARIPIEQVVRRSIRIRDVETNEMGTMLMKVTQSLFPADPWWVYSLMPAPEGFTGYRRL
ncbi:helix-turn-helix domain-containing protein [Nocardia takedensis]|uniref:helix-turn-helix domain-containing protein n=1 Tax=Nocardia takedensis TaxID=259390 RepID=UPI003F75977A